MITYVITGMVFSTLFNYPELYKTGNLATFMKDFSSPWIPAGPALQLLRGLLFSFVLWPFYDFIFKKENGWAVLWLLLFGIGIIGTSGPAPGSIEGIIFTKLTFSEHLIGLTRSNAADIAFFCTSFQMDTISQAIPDYHFYNGCTVDCFDERTWRTGQ